MFDTFLVLFFLVSVFVVWTQVLSWSVTLLNRVYLTWYWSHNTPLPTYDRSTLNANVLRARDRTIHEWAMALRTLLVVLFIAVVILAQ
jgi:hypothetical protein